MGVDVTILGPDKFDLEKTAALIDQAVAAQPDGIGLTVTDNVLFKAPIMKAIDAVSRWWHMTPVLARIKMAFLT